MLPANIIDRAASLKQEIAEKTEELRACNLAIAKNEAEYKPGSKTGHAFGNNFKAKVQLKTNVTWDQEALEFHRFKLGEDMFFHLFKWKFEPREGKAIENFIKFNEYGPILAKARTEKEGTPSITFEKIEVSA